MMVAMLQVVMRLQTERSQIANEIVKMLIALYINVIDLSVIA